jgi:hypothetical protein
MAAALCSSTLDDGVTLADDVLSNKSIGKSSSSSFDILFHPLNDDADGDMILFRPLSASLKVTTVPCCNTNEVDGVSETESRTSACSCSDDDLSEEFDVQVTLKKQQDKQDVAKQECCHQRRHVQFAAVSVREHAVTIGNHPYCTGAYPLTLDWPHTPPSSSSSYHGGGSEYEYSIDDYEDQQEQKRARRRHRSLLRVQTSFQRRESSSSSLATVHSLVGSQHQQHQQQQQQQAVAARLRQTQLPFRLSALERRARLATVRGASFATSQEEEFQRRREEQKAVIRAAQDDVGVGRGRGGVATTRGLVRTASMNSLVYSSTSSLIRTI